MHPVDFYKSLADETRLKILLLITRHEELCVHDLTEALLLSQPKVSRHLAKLRSNGLLKDRRHGQWVYYRLHPDLPLWAKTIILSGNHNHQAFIQEAHQRLKASDKTSRCF
ncbi:MAG: metalloregulator ArsR/SmtB family transcription factor [Pseudomonadales bacterium]|nr:metalloregulator ArsR/SmtB family transcription factor [Pseudomonadales bacterium]